MHCACLFFFPPSFNQKKKKEAIKVKYCINYKNMRYAHGGLMELLKLREFLKFDCAVQPSSSLVHLGRGAGLAFCRTETHGGAV